MPHLNSPVPGPPGQAAGGSFRYDPAQAPQIIEDLELAVQELLTIKDQALKLSKVDAGSRDSVSIDAATRLGQVAGPGEGSLASAVDAGINQLESLIASMKADQRAYEQNEHGNAAAFRI